MAENNENDPAASTQMFQAFVAGERANAAAPAEHHRSGGISPVMVGVIVVVVIAVVVGAVLAFA
ncbi:hypothetical protein LO772_18600 [Yinghuangia sp. ASG 101]|uniref:hypothetical protein n=1 Tax=Yinghuangia sp. ASG 101 TaxID=2896848 RepID=UPI001E5D7377|nr:hypothetical protein [Yinghuangia sp. ASG 101]UGQ08986.1 hypothetical protein LO772_18600 [Yinghuangia sp. ASG 101]